MLTWQCNQANDLIQQSKDWFETDEELEERVDILKRAFKGQTKKKGGRKTKAKGMSKKAQLRAARGLS